MTITRMIGVATVVDMNRDTMKIVIDVPMIIITIRMTIAIHTAAEDVVVTTITIENDMIECIQKRTTFLHMRMTIDRLLLPYPQSHKLLYPTHMILGTDAITHMTIKLTWIDDNINSSSSIDVGVEAIAGAAKVTGQGTVTTAVVDVGMHVDGHMTTTIAIIIISDTMTIIVMMIVDSIDMDKMIILAVITTRTRTVGGEIAVRMIHNETETIAAVIVIAGVKTVLVDLCRTPTIVTMIIILVVDPLMMEKIERMIVVTIEKKLFVTENERMKHSTVHTTNEMKEVLMVRRTNSKVTMGNLSAIVIVVMTELDHCLLQTLPPRVTMKRMGRNGTTDIPRPVL